MTLRDRAAAIQWSLVPFVDGSSRPSAADGVYRTINPANETALSEGAVGDADDIDAAVRIARRRFDEGCWSRLPATKRIERLFALADLISRHKGELALRDCLEMGKPIHWAQWEAESYAPQLLRTYANFADKLYGASVPLSAHSLSFNTYEPRGVVGAITPWNFPTACAVRKFAPALAAGNSVVLKPSEVAPSSALRMAELAIEAGIPAGVLNVVPGLGRTVGLALALHPDVNMISFTGSTATGRRVMEACARSNGKPLLLECGGKSPEVVFEDVASLDLVAEDALQNITWNQGQVCGAHTRLIVHESMSDALLAKLIEKARAITPGDPLDERTMFGPLASPSQRDRVKRYIDQGIAEGARAALRGTVQESGGCFVTPTIFDGVSNGMTIVQEEIFGPVLCVQVFRSEEEAIALANGTAYGLAATVWTTHLGRAKRVAHAIRAGHVSVRTGGEEGAESGYTLSHEPQKASGFGAEPGLKGLESYSTLKAVSFSGS
jgi:acyl-CoA reductase-like NAD-dependent aldehyde dehydrogenase